MPNAYLVGADLATFGVPNATAAQITSSSALIDSYLKRQEGLLYGIDGNQAPAYMLGAQPRASLTLGTPIAPGLTVTATLTGPTMMLAVGDVLLVDIPTPSATEALVVQSIDNQQVIFAKVQFAHTANAPLQLGLVITEQRTMPQGRPITQVSRFPIVAGLAGVGRYGYQRRGDDGFGNMDTYNLLAVMSKFGGPPAWEAFTMQSNSIDPMTGQVWVPAGVLLAYYTEVKISYIAGWMYTTLPYEIKQACANIINAQAAIGGIGGISTMKAGDTQITRFSGGKNGSGPTVIDGDTAALLAPYGARMFV